MIIRNLIDKYQFDFFKNLARIEYENDIKKIFDQIQKEDEFILTQKKNMDQLNKEETTRLVEYVKRKLKESNDARKASENKTEGE